MRMLRPVACFAASIALSGAAALASAQTVYKVGSTPTGVPFTFLDVKTNTIQGAMVDIINAIGQDAGFRTQIEATPFASLIPSLTTNRIDIISAAMLATAARREIIDFSEPVFPYPEGLVVQADDPKDYRSLNDLKDEVIGVQVGTVYVDFLKKNGGFKEIKIYDSLADILRDLSLGRIKAGVGDRPILAYQLSQNKDFKVKLARNYQPGMAGSIGIGMRKGDKEMLDKINKGLAKIKADGTLDRILDKWSLK